MPTTLLTVGAGVFIVALLWTGAVILMAILSKLAKPARFAAILIFVLAFGLTFVFVFFPRSPETPSAAIEVQISDSFFIGRFVLLTIVAAALLAAIFILVPVHLLEPVYARPLKPPQG